MRLEDQAGNIVETKETSKIYAKSNKLNLVRKTHSNKKIKDDQLLATCTLVSKTFLVLIQFFVEDER